jgi:RNA polymerase sigma-70 factor (ECF subfamily)
MSDMPSGKLDTLAPTVRLQPVMAAKSINLVDATVSDQSSSRAAARDADLFEAHRQRDYAAVLNGLMQRYRQKVVNLAYSIVREPALAQDLAQLAFLKLWQALPQFDGRAALSTWLYTIARNTCLSALRDRGRTVSLDAVAIDEVCDGVAGHDTMGAAEAEYDVARLLDELPEPYRRVVMLFYLEERSCESVAQLLDMPQGTVKSLLFRARARLAAKAGAFDEHSNRHRGVVNGS